MAQKMGNFIVDVFNSWNISWKLVGISRTWLGRLVVLGSCWKCIFYALACNYSIIALINCIRETRYFYKLEYFIINTYIFIKFIGNIFSSLRNISFSSCICKWSWKRTIYFIIFNLNCWAIANFVLYEFI